MSPEAPDLSALDRLRKEQRMFPVMGFRSIPWALIAPHEAQAQYNHDQTLEQLAGRDGLGIAEAVCVIDGIGIRSIIHGEITDENARPRLAQILAGYFADHGRVAADDRDMLLLALLRARASNRELRDANHDMKEECQQLARVRERVDYFFSPRDLAADSASGLNPYAFLQEIAKILGESDS